MEDADREISFLSADSSLLLGHRDTNGLRSVNFEKEVSDFCLARSKRLRKQSLADRLQKV